MASALLLNSPEEKTRRFRDRQDEVEEGGIKRAEARREEGEEGALSPRAKKSEEEDTRTKDEEEEMGQSRDSKEVLWGEEDKKRGGKDLRGEEAVLETQSKEKGEKFLQAGETTTTTASSFPTAEKNCFVSSPFDDYSLSSCHWRHSLMWGALAIASL